MIRTGARYLAFTVAAYAVFDVVLSAAIHRGYDLPQPHPTLRNTWIVERDVMSAREWNDLARKRLIVFGVTWVFATGGASITLPSDYNTSSNQWNVIGAGAPGSAGQGGSSSCPCLGFQSGGGGTGGGGGALSNINNYSGHTAGQIVSIQVGTGDTWFNSTSTLLAKAGSTIFGGSALAGVGQGKANGGNGGTGGAGAFGSSPTGGGGGGGGGAGGNHANGNNGANGGAGDPSSGIPGPGGMGGAGDGGNTPNNQNGTQFAPNPGNCFDAGAGGGGDGGNGGFTPATGVNGNNGGFYGAGGGGGGGGTLLQAGGNGGNATQGLLAGFYTPSGAAGARGQVGFVIA